MAKRLKILLVSPEVHPYAKTGGLADMVASLGKALHLLGHDVRLIVPKYKSVHRYEEEIHPLGTRVSVPVGKETKTGILFETKLDGKVPVYFVANEEYFFRDHLYGEPGGNYKDNAARYIFFCRSVLETCKALSLHPDIIHCSDWQTGLVPVYLKTLYKEDACFKNTRTVFSIHNLGYQGNFWNFDLPLANLPWDLFTPEGVEFYGKFSFLKSGLIYSDLLTTVSPSYSKEICSSEFGFRMEGVLSHRSKDLYGILNGVDYTEWNPAKDPWIKKNYGPKKMDGKIECRKDLLDRFSLKNDAKIPVLSMVTRLFNQKGVDLILKDMEKILANGVTLLILGTGEKRFEAMCQEYALSYPDQFACMIGFDEPLAHQIFAGSDILLVPSRYEPCGLTQMYGLKYGTVPLVRSVGGLKDSVLEFNPKSGRGTGFKFKKFDLENFQRALRKALKAFKNKNTWHRLMRNGMTVNHGWGRAAKQYLEVYRAALKK